MGVKTMNFRNREGDRITVTFKGDSVGYGELTPAQSPVVLQMDGGGGEYKAVKYTTASISILCDGLQHLDLFATSPLAVSVTVKNMATDKTLFKGFVSSNTFNQQLTGYNDALTIECVDSLGVLKFIQYERIDESVGFQAATIKRILKHIAGVLEITNVFLPYTFVVENGDGSATTDKYQELTVSEEYFYESTLPKLVGENEVSIQAQAITCFDSLEMIASSLRATFVQIEENLFLVDELAISNGKAITYLNVADGSIASYGESLELTEDMFDSSGVDFSLLPRYSQFSIKNSPTKELPIILSAFEDEYFFANGDLTTNSYAVGSSNEGAVFVQPLASHVYDVAGESKFYSYVELKKPNEYSNAWKIVAWGDGKQWQNYLRIEVGSRENPLCVFTKKTMLKNALPARENLGLKLEINACFSWDFGETSLYPYDLINDGYCRLICTLTSQRGETTYYYDATKERWVAELTYLSLYFRKAEGWRSDFFLINSDDTPGFITPGLSTYSPKDIIAIGIPGDTVNFRIYNHNTLVNYDQSTWNLAFIKELNLAVVPLPDVVAAGARDPLPGTEYKGVYAFNKIAETVTFPIEISSILSKRYFGTIIAGVDYMSSRDPKEKRENSGRWCCRLLSCPSSESKITMLERVAALGNFGDGRELEMTLRDERNNKLSALTTLTSTLWSAYKIIVALTRDISESNIRIKLN